MIAERVDLARHRHLHDEALGVVRLIGHAGVRSRKAPVDRRHAPGGAAIDEEPVDEVQEVVARRARHEPRSGRGSPDTRIFSATIQSGRASAAAGLAATCDAVVRGERLEVARAEVRHEAPGRREHRALLGPPRVFDGRVQTVGMVDPQAGDLALAHEAQDELVGDVETSGTSIRTAARLFTSKKRRVLTSSPATRQSASRYVWAGRSRSRRSKLAGSPSSRSAILDFRRRARGSPATP